MRASLIRTGSVPVLNPVQTSSPRLSLPRQASFSGENSRVQSPTLSMHFDSDARRDLPPNGIRRVMSESLIRSASEGFGAIRDLNRRGARPFPAIVREEENEEFGGGSGYRGGDRGIATVTGGNGGDRVKIGAYYEKMLKSNPTDALLLRNYGKFLHEVEKDTARAEEYYGRAILANPGDGELLSLYGTLIWETQRDEERAKSYFDQAVYAAPDDCTVLGSYAHFMWEAEEEEEEEVEVNSCVLK
ncbi:hypothetical protein PIB30_016465 [Stylosanthes scabra]|uniref:TmcB/TmcC TPR repeats domain-containing protein n=1 Tax=Stylosanthes scabra TaxID=79078 RepID=A0ABU6X983_9FABA|nr:hypothetical protein [Stylosanthes scabra]